jgi:serine/threonine protein kinase/Tfp pilus assembly protein PilF
MGVIYRAHDTQLDRPVALKVLAAPSSDAAARARIIREARAASVLNHPNICTVHEVTEFDGRPCLVMEYVDGRTLDQVIPPDGLPIDQVVRYGTEIADALAHAHDHGVVHCDLKSSNVMVTRGGRVKVLDFGLARRLRTVTVATEPAVGDPEDLGGTLPYMSPQSLEGQPPGPTDDVWSLGVLLYEMTTGTLPFGGVTRFQLAAAIQHETPAPMPERVPAGVRAVVRCCLKRDAGMRYQQAGEVRAALDAVHAGTQASAGRPRLRAILTGGGVVAAMGMMTLLLWPNRSAAPPDAAPSRPPYTANGEAYQLYLKGLDHYSRSTPEDYQRSLGYFRQAIQRDPQYPQALAGLARVLSHMTYEGLLPPSTYREVETTATRALMLDDRLGEAHEALAEMKFAYEWNWEAAEREFQKARALSPRDHNVHRYYALFLRTQRRWPEAIRAMEEAVMQNPLSADTTKALGATYFWAGQRDRAVEQYLKALSVDPTHAQTYDLLADAYASAGRFADALNSRGTSLRLDGAIDVAEKLVSDGAAKGYEEAMRELHRRYLSRLEEVAASEYVSSMDFAMTYVALGETERAFAMLTKAYGERAPWLTSLAADPAFDPLRSDPRLQSLITRVGIPVR